jgi:hypothetical protein
VRLPRGPQVHEAVVAVERIDEYREESMRPNVICGESDGPDDPTALAAFYGRLLEMAPQPRQSGRWRC